MDPTKDLRDAADELRALRERAKELVSIRDKAIYDATDYGVRTAVIREITGLSAQQLSRILDAERKRRGIPQPARPARKKPGTPAG